MPKKIKKGKPTIPKPKKNPVKRRHEIPSIRPQKKQTISPEERKVPRKVENKIVDRVRCPHCDTNLSYCQDAIVGAPLISINGKGKVGAPDLININYLDNSWLECSDCGKTSEDDDMLKEIYHAHMHKQKLPTFSSSSLDPKEA